ncbi:unannotated protein [freshwater metagenome]|uniref:Unannotated protein n=1 Tax=freshwater metagenome TaxID=449393 RepID=A0A6J7FKV8_9ZZZZ
MRTSRKSVAVNTSRTTWATRVLWLTLPLTLGDCLASAISGQPSLAVWVSSVTLWFLWGAGLLSSLIQTPLSLTALRICAPLPILLGVAAAAVSAPEAPSVLGCIGLATAAILLVLVFTAELGDGFVNGSSYGEERRMALRPSAAVLLGAVELVWLLTVVPLLAALWMLATANWVAAGVLAAVGAVSFWWGFRTLYRLSQRWVVFVPAGMTLVDPSVIAEPTLFRRDTIVRLGPALAESPGVSEGSEGSDGSDKRDGSAIDLSSGAAGLILQIDLSSPALLLPIAGRSGISEPIEVSSVLLAPSRPGALLAEAERRRITVQRS